MHDDKLRNSFCFGKQIFTRGKPHSDQSNKRPICSIASQYCKPLLSLLALSCLVNDNTDYAFPLFDEHQLETQAATRKKPHRSRSCCHFIWDSGATIHVCNDASLFKNWRPATQHSVRVANGKVVTPTGMGEVDVQFTDINGKTMWITLRDVLYIPDAPCSLISIRKLWKHNKLYARFKNNVILKGPGTSNQKFELPTYGKRAYQSTGQCKRSSDGILENAFVLQSNQRVPYRTLHTRLGHASMSRIKHTFARSTGLPHPYKWENDHDCDECATAGSKKPSIEGNARVGSDRKPNDEDTPYEFGDLVCADLLIYKRDSFIKSLRGNIYTLGIQDVATRYVVLYHIKNKTAPVVEECLRRFVHEYKHYLRDGKIVRFHTDNGGEFDSTDAREYADEICNKRTWTIPNTHNQNAYIERVWGSLLRTCRITMHWANVPPRFWEHAMDNACMLHNKLASNVLDNHMSPHEALFGTLPSFDRVRTWGCLCFYHRYTRPLWKLSPPGIAAINLGRDPSANGYIIYIPSDGTLVSGVIRKFKEHRNFYSSPDHEKEITSTRRNAEGNSHIIDIPRTNDHIPATDAGERRDDTTTIPPWDAEREHADLPDEHDDARSAGSDDNEFWSSNQCPNTECKLPRGHDGPCSHLRDIGRGVRRRVGRVHDANYLASERLRKSHMCEDSYFSFIAPLTPLGI